MKQQTLYQIDSKGNTRQWSIYVRPATHGADIVVEAGIMGGKLVETVTPIDSGKNTGRANATDPYQQACAEAQSEVDKKLKKGYVADLSQAKSSATLGSGVPAPMLAQKYDPAMKQGGSKDLAKLKLLNTTVYASDKLDGNRCIAHVTTGGTKLFTRKGLLFPNIHHIQDQLTECFKRVYGYVNSKYGVTEYWVDGELFTQKYSFNKVNGILKKGSLTPDDMRVIADIGFHIYDVILPAGYETRYKVIQYFKAANLFIVEAKEVKATEQTLTDMLEEALARGQEGLIVRQLGVPYEHKRTWQLLKYKVFEDDEFTIVGFKKSITGDTLGSIEFDQGNGNTFYATFNGTDDEQQHIWDNRPEYLGQRMTVQYFGFSPIAEGGRPRFPKAKALRGANDN